MRKEAIESNLR